MRSARLITVTPGSWPIRPPAPSALGCAIFPNAADGGPSASLRVSKSPKALAEFASRINREHHGRMQIDIETVPCGRGLRRMARTQLRVRQLAPLAASGRVGAPGSGGWPSLDDGDGDAGEADPQLPPQRAPRIGQQRPPNAASRPARSASSASTACRLRAPAPPRSVRRASSAPPLRGCRPRPGPAAWLQVQVPGRGRRHGQRPHDDPDSCAPDHLHRVRRPRPPRPGTRPRGSLSSGSPGGRLRRVPCGRGARRGRRCCCGPPSSSSGCRPRLPPRPEGRPTVADLAADQIQPPHLAELTASPATAGRRSSPPKAALSSQATVGALCLRTAFR